MYKQARQLLLMKQAVKRDAEVSVHQPRAQLEHILKVREDTHAEYCNLLVAVVTLVMLLAMSQKTVKLPQDPASTWSGAVQLLPALTPPPTLSEGGPALQLPQNESKEELLEKLQVEPDTSCDGLTEPEKSCDVFGDGDSRRDEVKNSGVVEEEEQHALEASPCVTLPSVASFEAAQAGEDAHDEPLEVAEHGNIHDKEVSEKLDDQDEVSSCGSCCGTSDGYEKLEMGGNIFMDEEEDANSESCT